MVALRLQNKRCAKRGRFQEECQFSLLAALEQVHQIPQSPPIAKVGGEKEKNQSSTSPIGVPKYRGPQPSPLSPPCMGVVEVSLSMPLTLLCLLKVCQLGSVLFKYR